MSDSQTAAGYTRSFVVPVPVARAWQAFVDPLQRQAWIAPAGHDPLANPEARFPADGFPASEVKIGEVEPLRRLGWSVRRGQEEWIDVHVLFAEVEGGARVTLSRSACADAVLDQLTRHGLDEELTDLTAYLESGVNVSRHFSGRSSVGAQLIETSAGLRIARTIAGGFAENAGLREGDLLISIAGAAIYARAEIAFLEREHRPGEILEATWVRDGSLKRGRAPLSERYYSEIGRSRAA